MQDADWIRGSDAVVLEHLEAELRRVEASKSHFDVLGCTDSTQIREYFLSATKIFHPSRFARRTSEIRFVANSLFVKIKTAYERARSTAATETLLEKRTAQSAKQNERKETPSKFTDSKKSDSADSEKYAADREEMRNRRRSKLQDRLNRGMASNNSSRLGQAGDFAAKGTSAKGTSAAQVRTATDRSSRVAEAEAQAGDLEAAFEAAMATMKSGDFERAAAEFKAIAISQPRERRYRLHMHYAQGRRLQAEGKLDEARSEYKRCLGMDASFTRGQEAMASLPKEGRKNGGLISKLFGK